MVRTANSARKQVSANSNTARKQVSSNTNTARKQVSSLDKEENTTKTSRKEKEPIKEIEDSPRKFVAEKRPAKTLSVSIPTISQKPKPAPRKSTADNVLREIKYYQKNIGFLVPRALIMRVVRQVMFTTLKSKASEDTRFTSVSFSVIHEAVENHIVCLLELSYMAARHAKRVTLFPSDIRLINRIRGAGAQ